MALRIRDIDWNSVVTFVMTVVGGGVGTWTGYAQHGIGGAILGLPAGLIIGFVLGAGWVVFLPMLGIYVAYVLIRVFLFDVRF